MSRHVLNLASLSALAIVAAGCSEAPPPQFRLNMVQVATNEIDPQYQEEIANVLGGIFGTPDNPLVLEETGLDQGRLNLAAGPAWTTPDDVTHGLYRLHCVHCHGITGDGRGPTARFLDPYPRDYRKGVFKFKSTYPAAKPTDEDLIRVLHNGIPGTSMPSFATLPQPEVEALLEYVKYLAIRGEMETELGNFVVQELGEEEATDANGQPIMNEDGTPQMTRLPLNPAADADQASAVKDMLATIVESWATANENVIIPTEDQTPADDRTPAEIAASIAEGHTLFYSTKANCFTCHGPTALGDGQQNDYDDWTKDIVNLGNQKDATEKSIESLEQTPEGDESDEQYEARMQRIAENESRLVLFEEVLAEQFPIRHAIPRNLRLGIYRGGRRRLDIFYRIHAGIKGVPMPGVGAAEAGAQGTLSDEEIWQLVDYVLSLPYELASGPDQDIPVNPAVVNR